MKKVITLVLSLQFSLAGFGQMWTEKNTQAPAYVGVYMSIDSLGYVYTGDSVNNFYCYNPATDAWTLKADFPGLKRTGAMGFTIGNYIYVGAGSVFNSASTYHDFYRYDPSADAWVGKASYPDSVQDANVFSIGNFGYVAGGSNPYHNNGSCRFYSKKCYQYDPVADQWNQKANSPEAGEGSFSTTIGGKAYSLFRASVCSSNTNFSNKVWEYDPGVDQWTQKANYPGTPVQLRGFNLNSQIYIPAFDTLRIFDPASNSWSTGASFQSFPCHWHSGDNTAAEYFSFTLGGKGYVREYNGCWWYFWEFNPNEYLNVSFGIDTFCADSIVFNVNSNITFGSNNLFSLEYPTTSPFSLYNYTGFYYSDSTPGASNGQYVVRPNWNIGGQINLVLRSTSPPGESFLTGVYLKLSPQFNQWIPTYLLCNNQTIVLDDRRSLIGNQSFWSANGSLIDTTPAITVSPTTTTAYCCRIVYRPTGCAAYDTTIVYVDTLPRTGLPASSYAVCPSSNLSLGGTAITGYQYSWNDNHGFTSTLASPTITVTASDLYLLTVTDTLSGCSATASVNVTNKQPPAQTLCMVSVDSASSHNIIVWEKLDKTATDSFYLLREMSTNNYMQIAAVPRDSLSEFEDYGADPNVTAYRYKIMVKDTCGNESTLSHYHNSIHLQYLGAGELIWNVYEIENETTPVSTFDVYRDSTGTGSNWALMVTVPGTQATATDINFNLNPGTIYQIHANWSYSCTPSRSALNAALSNIVARNFVTGVSNTENNSISVYPNPASTQLYVQTGNTQFEHISIYDAKGQKVIEQLNTLQPVDISKLEAGIYFVEAKNDGAIARKKFVKL
ncbi:MAG: type sorting protein [Bacteroidota bacterium]|nr:type sorting protein [Bacteroidota bacterium]